MTSQLWTGQETPLYSQGQAFPAGIQFLTNPVLLSCNRKKDQTFSSSTRPPADSMTSCGTQPSEMRGTPDLFTGISPWVGYSQGASALHLTQQWMGQLPPLNTGHVSFMTCCHVKITSNKDYCFWGFNDIRKKKFLFTTSFHTYCLGVLSLGSYLVSWCPPKTPYQSYYC